MTSLFPQLKRVDEDETSKIIKNVLFDDQEEKLQQILDEYTILTRKSITFTDDEDDDEEDDDEDEDEAEHDNNDDDDDDDDDDENDDDEDDDDEDDDDDDDDNDDDDDDDDDESSSSSDDEEEEQQQQQQKKQQQQQVPVATKDQPISWNLDQFIPVRPQSQQAAPAKAAPEPVAAAPELSKAPSPIAPVAAAAAAAATTTTTITSNTTSNSSSSITTTTNNNTAITPTAPNSNSSSKQQSSSASIPSTSSISSSSSSSANSGSSYMVQIDLSKLKRIPNSNVQQPSSASSYILTAKALKHEADGEKDKTKQAIKYLEAGMHFVLHGCELEARDSKDFRYYMDTIPLFKHTLRLSTPNSDNHQNSMTNLKVHTLCLRSISIIYMRLYKLREREMYDNMKVIQSQQNSSPIQHQADSLLIKPQLLSAYRRQIQIFDNLKYANEFWQKADRLCDQHPVIRIFFSTIESNCGTLTMTSSLTKLMDHVKCGLKLLRTS